MTNTPWDDESVIKAKQMWADGASASEIAVVIGRSCNAVIGKILRNKWQSPNSWAYSASPTKKNPRKRRPRSKAPSLVPLIADAFVSYANAGPKSIVELGSHECRWPLGATHEPPTLFCGGVTCMRLDGVSSPYCAEHHAIAYNHGPTRRRPSWWATRNSVR